MRTATLTIAMAILGLAACAQRPIAERRAPVATDARAVTVLDGGDGSLVGWGELIDAAATADVVVIGEMHGHDLGLRVAGALWDDVLAHTADRDPRPALSLEFFDRADQAHLDDYLLDVTDEPTFRERTGRTEGNYPDGHRAMVEAAKAAGLRVYAANAPRRYTNLAREEGFQRLRPLRASQKRLFEVPEALPRGAYRDRFFERFAEILASHTDEEETDEAARQRQIEGYFRAQAVWDATMADTISRAAAAGHAPVVHVVGQFHADHDGGLVQAVRARRPGARVLTVSMADSGAAVLAEEDVGRADFVVPVGEPE